MEQCCLDYLWAWHLIVYIDDILKSGNAFDNTLSTSTRVFRWLGQAKLKLAPHKCTLLQQKVDYLGHVISEEEISTDPMKLSVSGLLQALQVSWGASFSPYRSCKTFAQIVRATLPFEGTVKKKHHPQMETTLTVAPHNPVTNLFWAQWKLREGSCIYSGKLQSDTMLSGKNSPQ